MTAISTALFASIVTCVVTVTSATNYPTVKYVDLNCGKTIYVLSDVRIKLSTSSYLTPGKQCSVKLVPLLGTNVVVSFLAYSINYNYANEYGNCAVESIQMTDGSGTNVLGFPNYCSSKQPSGQFNLKTQGTFGFTVQQNQQPQTPVVELLVSEVVPKKGSCPSGYFDCQNNICVTSDVICNGYDDCGNDRDETYGCGLAVGVIVGIVVGACAFVFVLVVLSLVFRRYRQRSVYVQYR
ncbi:hypothetical protein BsWGS_11561 [Bradybaena similaris]